MDAFLDGLEPRQFEEWWASWQLEPWGEERADLRMGLLACAIERLAIGPDATPAWEPEHFLMFRLDADGEEADPALQAAALQVNLELYAAARKANTEN